MGLAKSGTVCLHCVLTFFQCHRITQMCFRRLLGGEIGWKRQLRTTERRVCASADYMRYFNNLICLKRFWNAVNFCSECISSGFPNVEAETLRQHRQCVLDLVLVVTLAKIAKRCFATGLYHEPSSMTASRSSVVDTIL